MSRALALRERLRELPYRIQGRHRCSTLSWPLTPDELKQISISWPKEYDWPRADGIVETYRTALADLVALKTASLPQKYHHVVMLDCSIEGKGHFKVGLDYNDLPEIQREAVNESLVYFKMEYSRDGYQDDRVLPGGYPPTGLDYYRYFMPFRQQYNQRRTSDILARFGLTFQRELREKGIALVAAMPNVLLAGNGRKVRYSQFLREAAGAKLSLDLPGNGSFTHRIAEFLGIGTCMISVPHSNMLHVPLVAGVHYVEVSRDLSDLQETCRYYIDHQDERERIAAGGREFFDRFLHCDQLAAYLVREILTRAAKLGNRGSSE